MKVRVVAYTFLIFLIILIQSTVLNNIAVNHVKPNLMIVFIISVALLRGNVEGSVIGFFVGLSQDIISGKILGFYTLLGLYLGLAIGSVNKRLYRENIFVVVFFTFIASLAYELTVYFLSTLLKERMDLFYAFKNIALLESLYNSIISVFVYVFIIKINDRFNGVHKTARKY